MENINGGVENGEYKDKDNSGNTNNGVAFFMSSGTPPRVKENNILQPGDFLFMTNHGFVLIWRKILETSFYRDSYAFHLATHCLLRANHKDSEILFNNEKLVIKRGQFVSGRDSLYRETGIKKSTIRNKLALLKNIGFLDIKSNNKFSVITICNYESYQNTKKILDSKKDNQRTARGQPEDTNNNVIMNNNVLYMGQKTDKPTNHVFTPPTLDEVREYMSSKGITNIDPIKFLAHYESSGWMRGKTKIKNWKACVFTWVKNS